ncbi:MAG: transglycosylase SLT domain-containing protein [Deltaproteobacteria bacterium]|nr:transglycosylase SLT domain-containing protein [Deltaproteobacteria bacterium]
MRQLWVTWILVVAGSAAGCSGDDSHKQPTLHTQPKVASDASTTPPIMPTPLAPGTPAPLTEAMASPYFQTGDARVAADAFGLEKWSEAQTAFTAARKVTTDPAEIARLELMLGLTDGKLASWASSAAHLAAAKPQLPLLADYINYHLALATYLAHRPGAQELATAVARDSIVGAPAEILLGDILRDGKDWAKVAAHYEDYAKRRPKGPHRSEVRFRLAEALENAKGDPATYVGLLRQITIDDTLSSWATRSRARLQALAPTLPAKLAAWDTLSAAEHIEQGMVLFEAMRNPESEAAFDRALTDKAISVADRCTAAYHRAQSRFKARDRKGGAPMFDDAVVACKAAANTDLAIKSHYQAARSYSFFGEHAKAIAHYQTAQTIDPKHSYSDDALMREGEEWAAIGDGKKVEEVLSVLPTRFPTGDNHAEAMWRLGWRNWREQKYDVAIGWWKKQIELVPHDDNYYGEGQPQYWLGRAYLAKGQKAEAIASWQAAVREYPAAYYAMLALNRVRETDAKAYAALLAEISTDPAGFDPKAPAFTFKPREAYGTVGFARAMELLRLGLGEPASGELRKLDLAPPTDKKRVDDADKQEQLWAMAYLYDRAGRYGTSHWPTRWHILDYRRQWMIGANRARWVIAYPRAYWELLNRHAALNKVPIAMQIGIVREESAFDPILESYANAIGLTQMIPPTAQDFSKGTGIAPTRENLRDPEKNVTIGSRFLGHLYKTWNGFTLLVPTSYNAGPAGVRRMLKVRGTWGADEFVEGIVDDQARNYTKRVLASYFTYGFLYDKVVPEIPNTIPAALLPNAPKVDVKDADPKTKASPPKRKP